MQPEGNWISRAPSLRRKAILMAKVQDEAGHGLYLYAAAETLGVDRDDLLDQLHDRPAEVLLDLQLPDADLGRRRRHRLAGRRRRDRQPGAAVPLLLRPVRPGDGPDLQGGVVPPAAGLRDPAHALARHARPARDGPGRGRPLWWPVADDVRPARRRRRRTPRSRWPGGSSGSRNDDLRQRFVDMTVPQAEVLGLTLPDPELRWNDERGHYDFGAVDFTELFEVIKGNGPCNRERMAHRVGAHEDGAWVREAAAAYAAKQRAAKRRRARHEPRLAAVGGLRPVAARAVARPRRLAARPRRRDGAAQRPRRLHPPAGGRLDLGGAGRRRSSRPARTRRTRSSTRPPTRSTGTRRSTTCPRGCEHL